MNISYSASAEFLRNFFGPTTEHNVEIRSLPQEHGGGPNRPRFTRDTEIACEHLVKWDLPGRACYFGSCTRITGKASGTRADCAEMPGLWVDIDCEKQSFSKTDAVSAALSLPLRPSLLVDSGGGIHGYWLLNEAMPVLQGPLCDDEAIIAVLRQLAGVLAGDPAVCDIARVMRLPGTSNFKYGEPRLCSLLDVSDFGLRYEFSDLVEMLDVQRPVLRSAVPVKAAVSELVDDDPFLAMALLASRQPVDVAARLSAMSYLAAGEAGVHATQLSVTASLAATGVDTDEIVATVLRATEIAAGLQGASWNWKREEKAIREMTRSAAIKYPPKEIVVRQRPDLRLVGGGSGTAVAIGAGSEAVAVEEKQEEPPPKIKAKIAEVIRRFNLLYMVVNEEGRAMVYEPWLDARIGRWMYRRITFDDLKKFYLNVPIYVGDTDPVRGKPKPIFRTAAEIWLVDQRRRQFLGGITFDPSGNVPASVLNLWRGFAVEPVAGDWDLLRDHILRVICRSDMVCYRFLMGWMARLVQLPARQGEIAVVLRSTAHGAGKGTVARALMKILGQHAMAISSPRLLTGTFNGHLRDCVFLFADEAFWAGDKQGLGTLKSLITEPYLAIEAKNQTAVQTPNFIHLMMAANAEWVVPAALTDRRFFVLDVPEDKAGDHSYFDAIQKQLDAGGYAAMLYELLNRDISDYNPRAIPRTDALDDQRTLSLEPIEEWWQTCLHQGYVFHSKLGLEDHFGVWHETVSTELLYNSYLEFAAKRRSYRPTVRVHFGRFMRRMGAGPTRTRLVIGERIMMVPNSLGGRSREPQLHERDAMTGYCVGTLGHARGLFEEATNLHPDWSEDTVAG